MQDQGKPRVHFSNFATYGSPNITAKNVKAHLNNSNVKAFLFYFLSADGISKLIR